MNKQQHRLEARRRRMVNRSAAQNRQILFETIQGNTVNYAASSIRRNSRIQVVQDIDDPRMTLMLQAGIVMTMLGMTVMFKTVLIAAFHSLLI